MYAGRRTSSKESDSLDWLVVKDWVLLFLILILTYGQFRMIQRLDALGHLTVGVLEATDSDLLHTLTEEEFADHLLSNEGLTWRKWDGSEE